MDEREVLREKLRDMLQRVPPKVNNGGIEFTRKFLEFAKKARKVIDAPRSSKDQLLSTYNQAMNYYQ